MSHGSEFKEDKSFGVNFSRFSAGAVTDLGVTGVGAAIGGALGTQLSFRFLE
ncbi:hypothetical protein J2S05_003106 [Alkalicoccobacillus murimartini]|uniref:Uncharacterized protein n=1 Tax=Alkalicoccobacillus murimartini TaxID=171685 RepID=A0ABT9YKA0_9BACI|nr:hypothetical protein [Alkalicoccobacillus murimartini]